jgi:O-acetyl-ADP-ribose deacetylase (regulator of RNase III)
MKAGVGSSWVELLQGDIVAQRLDVLVNAANAELAGGGGVDGAIHRAAGPALMEETRARYPLGCPPGDAVATGAGNLPVKHIFHAVGPIWRGGQQGEPERLRSAYRRCLELAVQHGCQSIAFPSLSTGAYRFPVDLAAEHALDEVRQFLDSHAGELQVRFVLFDAGTLSAYARVLEGMMA